MTTAEIMFAQPGDGTIEREFEGGKRTSRDWRVAVAIAKWQGSPVRGFRKPSLLASNEWGATAAQCGAARKSKANGSATADPAATSNYRSGAICDVDHKTHSSGTALCCPYAGASAIRLSALKRSNAHLRQHHKPRSLFG